MIFSSEQGKDVMTSGFPSYLSYNLILWYGTYCFYLCDIRKPVSDLDEWVKKWLIDPLEFLISLVVEN